MTENVNTSIGTRFQFVDLTGQSAGDRPFDGMASGEFIDMYGRKIVFKKEEMATYVANTKAILASTKDSNGNVVGLPVDGMNHNHEQAAGWIMDVELSVRGDVIIFTPRWNDWGRQLIGSDLVRFFSPTVDLVAKAVLGGSLTNWPATRDQKTSQVLLRPIELSQGMYELVDESLMERVQRIAKAFRDAFRDMYNTEYAYPVDVFDSYVICEMDDNLYKVSFTESKEGFAFEPFENWVKVKRSYVEQALHDVKKFLSGLFDRAATDGPEETPADLTTQSGVIEMPEMTREELKALMKEIVGELAAVPGTAPAAPTGSVMDLLDMTGLSEEAKEQRKGELKAQLALIRQQAEQEYRAELVKLEHEGRMTELAQKLSAGSSDAPRGFRATADELKEHLLRMAPEEAKWWGELLASTQEKGFVEFRELGHGKVMQGTQPLPGQIAVQLKKWIASGQTIESFFEVNAVEVGVMSDYNLAEFQPKEK